MDRGAKKTGAKKTSGSGRFLYLYPSVHADVRIRGEHPIIDGSSSSYAYAGSMPRIWGVSHRPIASQCKKSKSSLVIIFQNDMSGNSLDCVWRLLVRETLFSEGSSEAVFSKNIFPFLGEPPQFMTAREQ
jgi:hypothetical protein